MEFEKKTYIASIAVLALLFISVIAVLLYPSSNPTGMVVLDQSESIKEQLLSDVRGDLFSSFGPETKMCIMVPQDDKLYSFNVDKNDEFFEVNKADNYECNGEQEEDLIIKFKDYESFAKYDSMDCSIKLGTQGKDFDVLPSRFVEGGTGQVTCTDEFKEKFCGVVDQCMNKNDLKATGLAGCCEKASILEMPSFISNSWWIILIITGLLVGGATVGFLFFRKGTAPEEDTELQMYISSCVQKGYQEFQIRNVLLQAGWKPQVVEKELQKIRNPYQYEDPQQRFTGM